MKKLLMIVLAVGILVGASNFCFAYTFDGEIDPGVFPSWEVMSMARLSPYEVTVVVRNPDTEAKILRVVIRVEYGGVKGYGYTIDGHTANGKTYVYLFNLETGNYDESVE